MISFHWNSKFRLALPAVIAGAILIIRSGTGLAADLEIGKWGLESTAEFKELKATAEQDSSYWPDAKEGETRYRYFAVREPNHSSKALPLYEAAIEAYDKHRSEGGDSTVDDFRAFVKEHYPFIAAGFRDIAPVLFFDFRGAVGHEYILDEITVEVAGYSEFRGGGFSDKESWYDIVLVPEPGIYPYPVENKKLRFSGSGRTELRFYSANFYPAAGLSPMGAYLIDISFTFRVDGTKDVNVRTGLFKIDV